MSQVKKIRTELDVGETIAGSYRKFFLGNCFGIGLQDRGKNDPHICFVMLVEDDGNWRPGYAASSSWLHDLTELTKHVTDWCVSHGVPDIYNGTQYGWRFPNSLL